MFDLKKINSDKYIEDSLLEINNLSSKEIMEQLEKLKETVKNDDVPIYPFHSICFEDGKRKVVVQKIKEEDAAILIQQIFGHFCSYVMKEAYRLCKDSDEELREFCGWLKYLDDDAPEEERDLALEKFDNTFSFLEEVPVYSSIYYEFRKDYFRLLEKNVRYVYSGKMLHKEGKQDSLMAHIRTAKKCSLRLFWKNVT